MGEDFELRKHYLRRMVAGGILLAFLAVPAFIHSRAAIDGLLNQPIDWVPDTLPEKAIFNDLCRRFVVADAILISWPGATLESEGLSKVTDALNRLASESDGQSDGASKSEFDEFDSVEDQTASADVATMIDSIRELCGVEHPFLTVSSGTELIAKMTSSPSSLSRRSAVARLKGFLVGPEDEQTCMVVTFDEPAHENRRGILPLIRNIIAELTNVQASQIAMVGGPRDGADVDSESIRSVNVFAPPSAIIAALICLLCLRSIPLTIAITVIAVIGEGMVLAMVHYSGTPMSAVLIVLPPLVFVLTISAGIHLSNYFIDASHEFPELSASQAARRAVRAGIVPCFLATGTTVIGLSSLMLVRIGPIRVFGFVASVGVLGTLLLLLLVLPGAMILGREWKEKKQSKRLARLGDEQYESPETTRQRSKVYSAVRTRLSRPWPTIIVFMFIAGGLASGLFSLKTSVNLLRMFKPESSIRQEYAWFEANVGATSTAELLVQFPPLLDQDSPLDRFAVVQAAHIAAVKSEPVGGAISAVSFVRTIPRGRSMGASSRRAAIAKMIRNEDSGFGRLGMISRDSESEVWRITLRLWEPKDVDYSVALGQIQSEVAQAVDESAESRDLKAEVILTGPTVVVHEAQRVLLKDLFRSFLTAFAIVAVVMVFVLKSIRGGMIAMIPNLFPTVALFGFMGLMKTPLDIGSVMTASVALGIAVDDTVHLLSRFGSRRAQGLGQIRAAHGALSQCGWAMLQTTMVCGLSLMVYWFSDFVPTSQFALLMFGLLSAALFGDVFLLPSLMASPLGHFLAHTVGSDPEARIENDQKTPVDARRIRVRD